MALAPELILSPLRDSEPAKSLRFWTPKSDLGRSVRKALRYLPRELADELIDRISSVVVFESRLELAVCRSGRWEDLGVVSRKVITTAGVTYLCADIAGGASDSNLFKFHGFGTGTNAEAIGDTALQTELTTQYATDNVRPTGSQTSSTNTYTTAATLAPDSGGTLAITEHGLFTQAATGGGTLWDRSVFAAVNLVASADSAVGTYVLTASSGG